MSRMAEFYAQVCFDAGLDPCVEENLDRVSEAMAAAPAGLSLVDLHDVMVDDLAGLS